MTTEYVPTAVGVPEMVPPLEMLRPGGSDEPPAATHDQV